MSAPIRDFPALLGGTPVRPEGPPAWPLLIRMCRPHWRLRSPRALGAVPRRTRPRTRNRTGRVSQRSARAHLRQRHARGGGRAAALRVGAGDEVVLAAYDYESNFLTVHALGAKPVLIDVHPDNWQFDPANLEAAITPQTKAVICSHLHGGIVPMREVMEIAASARRSAWSRTRPRPPAQPWRASPPGRGATWAS